MANIDYKSAYQELVNSIRKEKELWSRESEQFKEMAFKSYCDGDLDAMRAAEDLEQRYDGMADECQHILEEADFIMERMMYKQEQQVKLPAVPTDDNGRVSLHLVNLLTGVCVYDLDCNPSEMPSRVWVEVLCSENGNIVQASSQQDHIHQMRMNEMFGYALESVWNVVYPYVWRDDCNKSVDYGPYVWMAKYTDTALAPC